MADKYSIDSQKLMYHPERIYQWSYANNEWDKLKKVYPIYVEISPYGGCNHRCTFCGLDYMGYENIGIEYETLKKTVTEMGELGVKSIMFAGEGEPMLFKGLDLICKHASSVDVDTSLTTNFVPATLKNVELFMQNCSWIKVSLNAGTKESYAQIHDTKEKDFDKVIENLKHAVKTREEQNLKCTLGVQMLLLPENKAEAVVLAKLCKDIGVDYLVIKPYSQHLFSETTKYKNIDYSKMLDMEDDLNALSDDSFNVVFRSNTMKKYVQKKPAYDKCLSTPFFWGYIAADGKVFGCSAYLGDDKFCYGNIYDNTFQEIWESEERRKSYEFVKNELDIKDCRVNCRMDEVNRYLWRLTNPNDHDNFI